VVVLTLVAHAAYYTVVVGGDHFEYRVYNHLVPFFFVSFLAALFGLAVRRRTAVALGVLLVLLSLPVQWSHWALTHNLNTRDKTYVMVVPIADRWPGVVRWYARLFDGLQGWLIPHHVCMRHQEHKIFHEHMLQEYPSREEGSRITNDDYPVYLCTTVGVPGWVLPNVNILDKFGLNDYVIARSPVEKQQYRLMAHERRAPKDYIDGFSPNVRVGDGRAWVNLRDRQLTADNIIAHEAEWERLVRGGIQSKTR
jgi:arabinofuranosyltransferase